MKNHLTSAQPQTAPPLVELRGITKRFPGVVANDDICLTLRRGEIHSLLGENGAGKSTLLNILSGMIQPDAGQILIDGQTVKLASPHQALGCGIGTVYQHFTLIPNLSVIENVLLGLDAGFILNLRRAEQRLGDLLGDFGLAVSARMEAQHLSLGQQQRVEIIKTLFRGSRLLLLDEPTSVLNPLEVNELFEILSRLKAQGVSIVFITHKLDEALTLSDRITILRQGQQAGELGTEELAQSDQTSLARRIVALMFGEEKPPTADRRPPQDIFNFSSGLQIDKNFPLSQSPIFNLQSQTPDPHPLCTLYQVTALSDRGISALHEVTLEVRAGEILGIAGVDGNGQKELGEVLAGQRPIKSGQIRLAGVNLTGGVAAAKKAGIGYISDDRLGEASVPALSVAENAALKQVNQRPFSRWTLLSRTALAVHARRLIQQFNIKAPGPWVRLGTLSGGNIQKLLLARELASQPKVLICNKPTQGLDVLTSQFVLQTLREQAEQGMAVMLISAELEELLAWSDRIGVMYNGRLQAVIPREQAGRESIARLMVGLTQ